MLISHVKPIMNELKTKFSHLNTIKEIWAIDSKPICERINMDLPDPRVRGEIRFTLNDEFLTSMEIEKIQEVINQTKYKSSIPGFKITFLQDNPTIIID